MGDGLGTGLGWTRGGGNRMHDGMGCDAMCCIINVRLLQASLTLGGRVSRLGRPLPNREKNRRIYPYIQYNTGTQTRTSRK